MSTALDARAQAAAILATEAQRLAAHVPPVGVPDAPLHKRATAMAGLMNAEEALFLAALAAFLRGEDPPAGNPYTISFERQP